jgi:hypothetical protein
MQVQLEDEDKEAEEVLCKTSMVKINEKWGHGRVLTRNIHGGRKK